jgi:hypothetical protein
MFYGTNSLTLVLKGRRVFRDSKAKDSYGDIAYVRGWAAVGNSSKEAKIFYFRDHSAGWNLFPKVWDFGTFCVLFLKRFKAR